MVQKRDQLHRRDGESKRAGSVAQDALAVLAPDLAEWPRSWRYEERDILPGEQIVACLTPFLLHLLNLGLSKKTLRRHRDNLWRLGGELIRDLQEEPKRRKQPIAMLVRAAVSDDGGPFLCDNDSEEDQSSFDATCRKLARFFASDEAITDPA
jgi:hypothetical protein